jgi:hypothetical protein
MRQPRCTRISADENHKQMTTYTGGVRTQQVAVVAAFGDTVGANAVICLPIGRLNEACAKELSQRE